MRSSSPKMASPGGSVPASRTGWSPARSQRQRLLAAPRVGRAQAMPFTRSLTAFMLLPMLALRSLSSPVVRSVTSRPSLQQTSARSPWSSPANASSFTDPRYRDEPLMSERQAKSVDWAMKVQASRSGGVFYWAVRGLLRLTLLPWLRVTVEGAEHLDTPARSSLRRCIAATLIRCSSPARRDVGFGPSARSRCLRTRLRLGERSAGRHPGPTGRGRPSGDEGSTDDHRRRRHDDRLP